ncbi:MAG: hypothetical protein IPJ74_05245 [Saprospiraceae bacterium]|nr:hypothetical protein [Saprospiraceae bacterium]
MKRLFTNFLLGLALLLTNTNVFANGDKPVASTTKFDFYNHYWTNLHHFLYGKAQKTPFDITLDSIENVIILNLKEEDRKVYDRALDFYKKYLAERSLLRDEVMVNIRACLIPFKDTEVPNCKELEPEHITLFKDFDVVYKKYFWKLHSNQNVKILNQHLKTIQQTEKAIFEEIANLSSSQWPEEKIRIDLSTYASRSGAYHLLSPTIVLISTASQELQGTQFLEMLFHESSHSIITTDKGAISMNIIKISKELGKQPPFDFWHIVLFYIAGKATQHELAKLGIEHRLYMEEQGIAKRYYNILNENMEIYMENKISLYEALKRTMEKA